MIGTRVNFIDTVRKINNFIDTLDAELYAETISEKFAQDKLRRIEELKGQVEELTIDLLAVLDQAYSDVSRHPRGN